MAITPITPTPDTQPLDIEKDLVDAQRTMLREVHDLVAAMLVDAAKQSSAPDRQNPGTPAPWARVVPNRTHRVVLLDGARGMGKTSLMLTLIRAWQGKDPTLHDLAKSLGEQGKALRILEPLDFDPKPRDLPLYAWLVQAFEPVVAWIEDTHRVDTEGLRQAWTTLFESAVLSDVIGLERRSLGDDLEMVVYQQTRGQRGWQALRGHWQRFLDQLLGVLERVDRLPTNGMLVLPIDDLDMQPGQAKGLLLALRLAWHPRLMLLLNGDSAHLTEVLTVELYGEEASVGRMPGLEEQKARLSQARHLADAVVGKTIAQAHRLDVPVAGLLDACRVVASGTVRAEAADTELSGTLESLRGELTSFVTHSPRLSPARVSLLLDSIAEYWPGRGGARPAWQRANTWAWRELVACTAPRLLTRLEQIIQIARDSNGKRFWPAPSSLRTSPFVVRAVPEWSAGTRRPAQSHGNVHASFIDVVEDVTFVVVTEQDTRPASPIEVATLALREGQSASLEATYVPSVEVVLRTDECRVYVDLPTLRFTSADHWMRTLEAASAYCRGGLAAYVGALIASEAVGVDAPEALDSNNDPETAWAAVRGRLDGLMRPQSAEMEIASAPRIWSNVNPLLEVIALLAAPEYYATQQEQEAILQTLKRFIPADNWQRATKWWVEQRHDRLTRAIEAAMGPSADRAAVALAKERLVLSLRNGAEDTVWHREIEPYGPPPRSPILVKRVEFSERDARAAVDLVNRATVDELKRIVKSAQAQVLHRNATYDSIHQIGNTDGIGRATLQSLRDHVAGG